MIEIDGRRIRFNEYPNGETLILAKAIKSGSKATKVSLSYESDEDLVHLMFVKKHLDPHPVKLEIRYMPYSRMDRAPGNTVFTLRHVTDFINWLNFKSVLVIEPHSDVTCALLDRSSAVYPTIVFLRELTTTVLPQFSQENDYLYFPDAGAQKRYANVRGYRTAVGYKKRDFLTGELSGEVDVVGFDGFSNPRVLIVDDLCSMGGTFRMSAEKLRSLGASEVYLFVAHCGNEMWPECILMNYIDGLYCMDTIPKNGRTHPKIHVCSKGAWS